MKKIEANDPETKSSDLVSENVAKLKALFPELVTEGPDGASVNVDVLKQLVGDRSVTDADEKYGLTWHGKRAARRLALTPSTGTLRPCPEESVDWETTQNLMIEGDNLEVLKLLQKSYAGKVKLIYIDPPYNTGKDFVYPDNFQDNIRNYLELTGQVEGGQKMSSNTEASGRFHTDWLNMLYPRLKLARHLLRDDGSIFISIDEKELQHLRLLCNDVFGEECFVAVLTVLCNPKGRSQDKYFATNHEYVLVYSKSVLPTGFFAIAKDEEQIEAEYPEEDEGGKYRLLELRNTHREFGKHNRRNLFYPLFTNEDGEVSLEKEKGWHEVLPIWDDGFEGCWTWDANKTARDIDLLVGQTVNGRWKIYRKGYASGADRMLKTILVDKTYYTERGQKEFNALFKTKAKLFQSPKSPFLLSQLFQTCTVDSDIVLDFFAGSGTTGHAVMAQNSADGGKRRYILVQLPDPLHPDNRDQKVAAEFCRKQKLSPNIAELTKERLRRAARKIKEENPMFAGDLGFRVFKLDSTNIREWEPKREDLAQTLAESIEHLKTDRSEADILYELLLKLGLDLCVPMEKREVSSQETEGESHTVHAIGGGVLMACLSEKIGREDVEAVGQAIVEWHKALAPAGDTTCVFRDSAFADDVGKTNMAAILEQNGIANVRSL
jgi:adenine-specific DNA-methyltransferase